MSSKKKASSQHKTKGSSSSSLSDQDDNETQVIDIIKFPRTPHLFATNKDVSRDDLVLDERDVASSFYSVAQAPFITLEEKIDGSNLGISLDVESYKLRCQNRSHYVTCQSHSQFKTLQSWLDEHSGELYALLSANNNGYILYGEWVYAKHSILYDKLPDTFIAFDIYDKHAEKFVSVQKRNQLLNLHAPTLCVIEQIPNNNGASLTKEYLMHLLNTYKSHYSSTDEPIEGVYIRIDEGDYLKKRAKVVRSDFIQAIDTHWSTMELVKNRIDFSLKKY
ncbi:hypothetical protein C9374_007145 [Naegleria lovaniensis]|uniref:RNA ligase domain-containing protein n=1 Tax=Naegleria lovaniensis TaxID=51637 RepID=A0AA88G533_NAELO|nr:uncharacterized protein C9374_013792 [Naegleria lovaniensis]XP_044555508.1 uncharacterized protein C9374_007145 [Naegleria lovaniensis]KAG2370836.1 hypothetical protein C9374_013792 [Naegleria lovaniensis]KAG2393614.1 hypothetical protein C9374_007145 [Naegleria lovaniensis]